MAKKPKNVIPTETKVVANNRPAFIRLRRKKLKKYNPTATRAVNRIAAAVTMKLAKDHFTKDFSRPSSVSE